MTLRMLALSLLAAWGTGATAADWPQWRGPNRDGKSGDTGLMKSFPEGGPKLAWSVTDLGVIGTGYGSPAVVRGKVFIVGADGPSKKALETCVCLDEATGKPLWKTPLESTPGSYLDGWGGGTRSTPTVDGDFVYVLGATGDLLCMTVADGKLVWRTNLVTDHGGGIPQWGYSESVLVDADRLVCTPGKSCSLLALDKKTGKELWKCTDFTDAAAYSSVIPATVGGTKQYITQTATSAIGVGADGKLLWKAGKIKRKVAVIPTPVLNGDKVFLTSGYGAGCELIQIAADGKGAKVVYNNELIANQHGGVVEVGGKLYGHSDSKKWFCYDFLSGVDELAWTSDKLGKGSITYADGQLYCYSEADGTLATVTPSDKEWTETGRFTIPEKSVVRPKQGKVWAHPVIANGRLYLRDYEKLFVYSIAAQKAE